MVPALANAHIRFQHTYDAVSLDLQRADPREISHDRVVRLETAKLKAFSYVWMSAAVERLFKDVLSGVYSEINNAALPYCDLRTGIIALATAHHFDSLQQIRHLQMWHTRCAILDHPSGADLVVLNEHILPYDGRTIRPAHFDLLRRVFGFPECFHSVTERAALIDLAEGRNTVAHGNMNALDFGRTKKALDVWRGFSRVADVIERFTLQIDDYLTQQSFRR